jgi:putative ABC transport system permease protein
VVRDLVQERLGIVLTLAPPAPGEWLLMGAVLAMALLAGCLPAGIAYRRSLADGLRMRL